MERNYDLVREILRAVKQRPENGNAITLKTNEFTGKFPKLTPDDLNEHINLLVEHGFLEGDPHQFGWFITRLTWNGHDFIGISQEETVWAKAKHYAGHLTLDVFTNILKESAVAYVKTLTS
jgi:hypothetical protein